jgi:hypothetical protein
MQYISRFERKIKTKKFIIPNEHWFKPLNDLDLFINKKHDLSKLLINEKILIKITHCRNHDLQMITLDLNKLPNCVYTFYTFFCYDNSDNVKENQDFTVPIKNNKFVNDCYHVTMELMKYYKKGSLAKFVNKFDKNTIIDIVHQLCYCQLNIFSKHMYTHNNIHLRNILIRKRKNQKELLYKYIDKSVVSKYEYIISDYDDMISFEHMCNSHNTSQSISEMDKFHNLRETNNYCGYSLFNNILQTINVVNELCIDKIIIDENKKQEMELLSRSHIKQYIDSSCCIFNQKTFIRNQLEININFLDNIIHEFKTGLSTER